MTGGAISVGGRTTSGYSWEAAGPPVSPRQPDRRVEGNRSATLFDPGDGCLRLDLHARGHRVDDGAVEMLERAAERAAADFEALVIGSEADHFGVGADLAALHALAEAQDWPGIETRIARFQAALEALRAAPVPVVAAPFLYSLGGSTEIALAADACQALGEVYLGLVEVGVGLVPAGGGCLAMAERWCEGLDGVPGVDRLPFLAQAAVQIALGRYSATADEARRLRYLRPGDGVTERREHLLAHARQRALGLARGGYRPPGAGPLRAAGRDAAERIEDRLRRLVEAGRLDDYGALVAGKVARILTGGDAAAGTLLTRRDFLDAEREAFLSLCGDPRSRERMRAVLGADEAG